jgi:hypothetical protein
VVGVVPHERREIEGGGQSGLTVLEQELESGVGVPCAAEPGELAHRPELPAVAGGMDAAGERVDAGHAQLLRGVCGDVERGIERLDFPAGIHEGRGTLLSAGEPFAPFRDLGAKPLQLGLLGGAFGEFAS